MPYLKGNLNKRPFPGLSVEISAAGSQLLAQEKVKRHLLCHLSQCAKV